MTQFLYLAELEAFVPATQSLTTLRYASGNGFVTGPAETPANTYYDGRIKQAVNIRRSLFSEGKLSGRSRIGYGDLVLLNPDGELDALIGYGLAGRAVTIRRGTPGAAYPSGFTTVFVGTMEQAEVSGETVIVKLRDKQLDLQRALQSAKYGGTNDMPNGLDGVAGDLAGKPKPVCLGQVYNAPVPCVNTAKLIYQVSDGLVNSVDAVYDAGVPLLTGFPMTSRSLGFGTSTVYGVAYGADLFVAVGDGGKLATSPDGTTWTLRTSSFGSSTITDVAFAGGLFVATGVLGTLATSPDGITWTQRSSASTAMSSNNIWRVTWGNGTWLIVGGGGKAATSADGITWTAQSPGFGSQNIYGAAYGNGRFVIGGPYASTGIEVATSFDGTTWSGGLTGSFGSTGPNIRNIRYGGGLFLAMGQSGTLATSPDGISWTSRTTGLSPYHLFAGYYGPGVGGTASQYVIGDSGGRMVTSRDGITWTQVTTGLSAVPLYALGYGDGRFIAAGGSGVLGSSGLGPAYASLADLVDDDEAPDPGTCRAYLGAEGSFVRLGASPYGQITADITEGAADSDRTAGQLFADVLTRAGKVSGDWSASDVTALDTAAPGVCGFWTAAETTFADVLDQIAASAGAWWGVDRSGVYRIQQLTAPAGTAVYDITANSLLKPLARLTVTDETRGLPPWRSIVRYQRNHAVQPGAGGGTSSAAAGPVIVSGGQDLETNTAVIATGSTTPRTLADRFAEVFNVLDFGAVGDGVTDDTAAIQAAIDACEAAGGGIVQFHALTYIMSAACTVTVAMALRGREGTVLRTSSTNHFTVSAPVDVRDIRFENTAAGTTVYAAISGDTTGLDGTVVRDCAFGRVSVLLRDGTLDTTASNSGIWIIDNVFDGDYTGATAGDTYNLLDIRGSNDVFVRGNQFLVTNAERFMKVSGSPRRIFVQSNSFVSLGGNNGKQAIDFYTDSRELVVSGNVFDLTSDFTACVENKNGAGSTDYAEPSEVIVSHNLCMMARSNSTSVSLIGLYGAWSVGTTGADVANPEGSLSRYTATVSGNILLLEGGTSPAGMIVVRGFTHASVTGNVLWRDSTPTFTVGIEVSNCRQCAMTGNVVEYGYLQVNGAASHPNSTTYTGQPEHVVIANNTVRAYKSSGAVYIVNATVTDAVVSGNLLTAASGSGSNGYVYVYASTVTRLVVTGNSGSIDTAGVIATAGGGTITTLHHAHNGWQSIYGDCHTVDGWYYDNLAAGVATTEMTRSAGRWAAAVAGSIVGLVLTSTGARSAGTCTATVYKNTGLAGASGSSVGLTAVLDGTNTSRKATTQDAGTDTFAAGDEIYAVIESDGSWAPTTADVRVTVLVGY